MENQKLIFEMLGKECLAISKDTLAEWLNVSPQSVGAYRSGNRHPSIGVDKLYECVFYRILTERKIAEADLMGQMLKYLSRKGYPVDGLARYQKQGYESFVKVLLSTDIQNIQGPEERQDPQKYAYASVSASGGVPTPLHTIPVSLNTLYPPLSIRFFGREALLALIREHLEQQRVAILQGIGGIGKSCTSLKYIETYSGRYSQIQHVYFDRNIRRTILKLSFHNLNEENKSDEEKFDLRIRQLYSYGSDTLLVIDNMDIRREDLDEDNYKALKRSKIHILITTRYGTFDSDENIIQVDRLSSEDQMMLFRHHYGRKISEKNIPVVEKLFRQVEGHTLLIGLIAKTMKNSDMTAGEMLDFLKAGTSEDLSDLVSVTKDQSKTQSTMNQYVSCLFDISSLDDGEKQALMLMSLVPLDGLQRVLFKKLAGYKDNNLTTLLTAKSWVIAENLQEDEDKPVRLRLHPVIWKVVIEKMDPTFASCELFLKRLLTRLKNTDKDKTDVVDDLCGLAQSLSEIIQFTDISQVSYLSDLAQEVYNCCRYTVSLDMFLRASSLFPGVEQTADRDIFCHSHILLYSRMAQLYSRLANYQESISCYQTAIQMEEREFCNDSTDIANLYNSLAFVYRKNSDYKDSAAYYEKARHILESLPDAEKNLVLATTYNDLGILNINQNNYPEAMDYYERGLKIRLANPDTDPLLLAYSYHNIGTVHQRQHHDKAVDFHKKALKIRLDTLSENHPDVAASYNQIGNDYIELGNYEKAWYYYQKALEIRRSILGRQHPDVAWTLSSIGEWFLRQEKYEDALKYYMEVIGIRKNTIGDRHAYTAKALYKAGLICSRLGRREEALDYLKEAEEIQAQKGISKELNATRMEIGEIEKMQE